MGMSVIAFLLGFGVATFVVPPKLQAAARQSARRLIGRLLKTNAKTTKNRRNLQ